MHFRQTINHVCNDEPKSLLANLSTSDHLLDVLQTSSYCGDDKEVVALFYY